MLLIDYLFSIFLGLILIFVPTEMTRDRTKKEATFSSSTGSTQHYYYYRTLIAELERQNWLKIGNTNFLNIVYTKIFLNTNFRHFCVFILKYRLRRFSFIYFTAKSNITVTCDSLSMNSMII